ncbi:hypothetical protein [Marvinbryantia sp.]|uniref:hypothetical protein n=1 Tax=Marvinbryantia sp. TaxID=2496532 RepID=UPI0025E6BA07|nr:hypothetical protein [uncultured Marvinbryantia sp.]
MKRMTLFLALFASAAIMLTGCKSEPQETEPATTEAPIMTEALTEAPTTEAPTETEKEDSMNRTRELKGLVKSSNDASLTIQTERGKELTFSLTGADIQVANGIQAGSNVTVMYKGTINGTDTANARVLMVTDLAAGETPVTEGELMTEAEEADPNAGAGTLGGTISDLSADRIVVLSDDGDSYYFSMYGADINLVNGMQEGNYVTVEYNGDIYGPDIVPATSISDNSAANGETAVAPGSPAGDYSYVSGTVEDCGVSAITITDDEGVTLSIDTSGATWYLMDGIASGAYVTIAYTGTLSGTDTTGVKGVAVYDTAGSTGNADTTANDGTTADNGTTADDGTVADDGMVTDDGVVSDDGAITDDGAGADDGAEV